MTCEPCKNDDHEGCIGECDCRKEDQQIEKMIGTKSDLMMADVLYSNILYSGSKVARMLTDGAGKDVLLVFIQQVLRANKAIQC